MTDVMDRMASQIEALTTLTMSNQSAHIIRDQGGDGNRRRPITELSHQEGKTEAGQSGNDAAYLDTSQGSEIHTTVSVYNLAYDQVSSPTKKKSRKQRMETSSLTLHSDLEEMSLGSEDGENGHPMSRMELPSQPAVTHTESAHTVTSPLEDNSDEFSTETKDDSPNLDTQYNFPSDPEGGELS
jgi:hypothetical protein